MAKLLLDHGADVNEKNDDGSTCLMLAAVEGRVKIATLLLEHNVDVNEQDSRGFNALMMATYNKHVQIAKLLLKHGAEVNEITNAGCTALMISSHDDNIEILKLLLANGADANIQDGFGRTAVMYTCDNGHLENTKLLLEHGADVNARNYGGITAVSMAVAMANLFGNPIIAILLLEHGAMPETLSAAMRPSINCRIREMNQIRESIKNEMLLIFPNHTPVVAKIISQFTNGLENLKKIAAEYIREN